MKTKLNRNIRLKKWSISSLKENLCTGILDVRGSYPEAPEAKLTPVRRSLG